MKNIPIFLCVVGIAVGQILFKLTSTYINRAGTPYAWEPVLMFCAACFIYGITSIGWVLILRTNPLSKVYPIMALTFVIVPILSHAMFDEKFTPLFFWGTAFIVIGIVMTVVASN